MNDEELFKPLKEVAMRVAPDRELLRATLMRLPKKSHFGFFTYLVPAVAVIAIAVVIMVPRNEHDVSFQQSAIIEASNPFDEQEMTREEQGIQQSDADFETYINDLDTNTSL